MKRICPFCKSVLHGNNVCFCTSCGNVLPDNIQLKDISSRNVREMNDVESHSLNLSKFFKNALKNISSNLDTRILLTGIGIGILVTICFYLLVRFTLPSFTGLNANETIEEVEKKDKSLVSSPNTPNNILNLSTSLKSGIFGQGGVANYVPHDVDLYMEFNDFSSFEPFFNFLGGEIFTLYENIKENVRPFYCAFLATRDGKEYWSFIFFPLKEDINVGSYSGLVTKKVGSALVVSENDLMIEEVESSKSGTQKSLSLDPSYVLVKNNLPVEGKVFVIALNDANKLKVVNILAKTTSEELKLVITSFKELNSNFMVVK
ncbi:MAG: TFIIB-type zinc ribbon-containing protein [Patescibacteria group bacterium]